MSQYGTDKNINAWLCDFLTNREMQAVIDGEEAVPIDSGVHQGTMLGPLVSLPHQQPPRFCEVYCPAFCRPLSALQSNQINGGPHHSPKRSNESRDMGKDLGNEF